MRSSDDLFRRHQVLRDQLDALKLLRQQVRLAERKVTSLRDESVCAHDAYRMFETIGRESLAS